MPWRVTKTAIPVPRPTFKSGAKTYHLTDDGMKTLCGKEIVLGWRSGSGTPEKNRCGICGKAAGGIARVKRYF